MYYINMTTQIIIGSSPESFVAVQDGRSLRIQSLEQLKEVKP